MAGSMGAEPARSRRQAVVHFAGMMPSNRADDESDVGKARPSPLGFRPDLEGVRAVAVALVLLSHFINWPTGGFIGVDVFFVLSGFLITGLLLKEYDRTGRISFRSFYIRRIKRILPASTLVIVVTALAVYTVFLGARVQQAVVDGGWALAFAANWRFVLAGQDYFAIDRAVSPFQHYWSLAVEEQFYLVWPLLVVLSIFLAARLGAHERYRPALALTLGGLTVASFVWACAETASAPTTAYFSTFSRAWELGAGGLLALLASSRHLRVPWPRTMSVAGLAVIVGSSALLDPTWAFPGPWAVLPVVGTLLVVYSGIGVDSTRLNPLLTNHVSRYVGRISFSLYLWHWPVVVVLTGVMGTGSLRFYAGVVLVTLVLSAASFHCVEDPVRRSTWLTGGQRLPRGEVRRERLLLRWQAVGIASLVLVTVAAVRLALGTSAPVTAATESPNEGGTAASVVSPVPTSDPVQDELVTAIQVALEAREWPEFSVELTDLEDAKAPEWSTDGCTDLGEGDLERCTYDTPAAKLAVVVGDSIAVSWVPGVRAALAPEGYATLSLPMGQCPAAHAKVESHDEDPGFTASCLQYQDWTVEKIVELNPDLVIASSAENSLGRLLPGAGHGAEAEWLSASEHLLEEMALATSATLVVLAPPPAGKNLQSCVTRFNTPDDCSSGIDDLWHTQSQAESAAVRHSLGSDHRYVDTTAWFCNSDGQCPAFVGDMPVRADGNHLTAAYSQHLGPHLRDALLEEPPEDERPHS